MTLPPILIQHTDYRRYLRDFYEYKKAQNPRFSFRRFSQLANLKSSNYLLLVMAGSRNLSVKTAPAVAKAMKLTPYETDYFVSLVKVDQATSNEDRARAEKDGKVAIKKIIGKDVPADKAEYLSVWYYTLVRELAFLNDFKPKASWISHKLNGLISEEQAEESIRVLISLGLWKRVRNKIEVRDVFLDTGVEDRTLGELSVESIHRQTLLAWSKIIADLPKNRRELGFINIPIQSSKISELKTRIQRFQDEIIGWLQDEKDPDQLVQLGTYLIPVTRS